MNNLYFYINTQGGIEQNVIISNIALSENVLTLTIKLNNLIAIIDTKIKKIVID